MQNVINVFRAGKKIALDDFENEIWQKVEAVCLTKLWSGADAAEARRAEARLIWTNENLIVRFDCRQREPLVVSLNPNLAQKTIGLWERDVCEIFVAPNAADPQNYFEFEVAPTGEWLDLMIRQLPDRRETDWDYCSGMKTAARIEADSFTIVFQIEWRAFGRKPRAGSSWRANLFRCVGTDEATRYLAWQPTLTEKPNFHVPAAFGTLKFK